MPRSLNNHNHIIYLAVVIFTDCCPPRKRHPENRSILDTTPEGACRHTQKCVILVKHRKATQMYKK